MITRHMLRSRRASKGFTLVELLVVIGIIALLISVLLPVLSGVQKRGRMLKCQSNMRTCLQMFMTYAAENKGSLPYGWYYNRGRSHIHPYDWQPIDNSDKRLTTAFSIISRMAGKQYTGDDLFIENNASSNPEDVKRNHAPYLKCPEAEQVLPHICSYAVQYLAFITPWYERQIVAGGANPPPVQTAPAKLNDLLPFMILIHDTAVFPGMIEDIGYVINYDVDDANFLRFAAHMQRRYYQVNDRYANAPPNFLRFRQSTPVAMGPGWRNIDPPPTGPHGFAERPYVGNLRFRHGKNDTINVGYADGRVEAIQATFNADQSMRQHDIPRRAFMIKWPKGQGLRPSLKKGTGVFSAELS